MRGPAAVEGLRTILSPEVMRGMDADLAVEVEQVVSGADHLGKGTLKAILRNGRLQIDPLELQVAGGDLRLALALDRSRAGVGASLTALIDRFDYGLPARHIDPQTEVAGLFSLDADLDSRGNTIADLAKHVTGHLDFALWPANLRGDVFDIWAVNLLVAILPTFDQGSGAKVNCVTGQFDLDDGLMRTKSLILDTTRVRVNGSGTVDFRTEEVDLVLQPAPKRPQFYSLATPLVVDGTFSDFTVGATPADLVGTVLRVYYPYLVVPFELLTRGGPSGRRSRCLLGPARTLATSRRAEEA